ncbi:hypothetical protein PybrP1_007677 [[Pythium] brassicae (nom. inval.)]|nr:hypothetical protein PybrP1_007677 [[Pythium] brassicae (nom. inval.)]
MASKAVGNVFQVLCPTRNYGVGARVTRKIWSRFTEPTYWEITRIQPSPDLKHGKVFGRFTFRGKTDPKVKRINVPLKKDWHFAPEL